MYFREHRPWYSGGKRVRGEEDWWYVVVQSVVR